MQFFFQMSAIWQERQLAAIYGSLRQFATAVRQRGNLRQGATDCDKRVSQQSFDAQRNRVVEHKENV
jgi:hypothetical protein